MARRRTSCDGEREYRTPIEGDDGPSGPSHTVQPTQADMVRQGEQTTVRRSARLRQDGASHTPHPTASSASSAHQYYPFPTYITASGTVINPPPRGPVVRRVLNPHRGRRRGGSSSTAIGSPPLAETGTRRRGAVNSISYNGLSRRGTVNSISYSGLSRSSSSRGSLTFDSDDPEEEDEDTPMVDALDELNEESSDIIRVVASSSSASTSFPLRVASYANRDPFPSRQRTSHMKRSWDKYESADPKESMGLFTSKGATAIMLYCSGHPDPNANDIWPNLRNATKVPAQYHLLRQNPPPDQADKTPRDRFKYLSNLIRPSRPAIEATRAPNNHPMMLRRGRSNASVTDASTPANEHLSSALPQLPTWPTGRVPTELFEEIAGYLNRDDIKSMRLVCREFDRHIAQVIFKTVVVPFNTEIYGMLGQDKPDIKGKKKVAVDTKPLLWKNANGDDVYNGHGLDVFRGFGQHILRYGMSFEVSEESLANPPTKSLTERHTSFWGSYDWPFEEYRRFDDVAGLEFAADETPRMKTAFSELTKVRELALSIDSGLGWLSGPDKSLRTQVLQRPSEVFGTLKTIPDRRAEAQRELWEHVLACHSNTELSSTVEADLKHATLYRMEVNRSLTTELEQSLSLSKEQPGMPYLDASLIQGAVPHDTADVQIPLSFDDPELLERFIVPPSAPGSGILFTSTVPPTDAGRLMGPLMPASLTTAQKEWLLETEWAQRAFLSSYMLSIMDNPTTFSRVHTLNIPRLSDRYLSVLDRQDFWDALPSLANVTLQVIPGWRTVNKDEAGFVETPKINPCSGIDPFYELVGNVISHRRNIQHLTIGWAAGGEHAEGVHARNRFLLPAPLLPGDSSPEQDVGILAQSLLRFPHVTHLTLKNCWITPAALLQFVKEHDCRKLRHLTLDSVSLTAVLREPGGQPPQNHGQQVGGAIVAGGMAAALAAAQGLHGPQAGNPNQQAFQGQQNLVQQQQFHLQFLTFHIQALQLQIQQLQTQNNPNNQGQLTQLQAQLQNQIQLQMQLQGANPPQAAHGQPPAQHQQPAPPPIQPQAPAPAPIQAPVAAAAAAAAMIVNPPAPQAALKSQPRVGSWMSIIDIISPGINLTDFSSEFSEAVAGRRTALESINFISCGYARLPYAHFIQPGIESLSHITRNPISQKRYNSLLPAMLPAKWPLLGEVVPDISVTELSALNAGWDLETGWQDSEEAQGPEFDGCLPGGTGRFSGVIRSTGFGEGGAVDE
ncbi:hypothetical protein K491DRAFT_675112 [Lophiostoma macrostomum CBS 122681]|uniref:F-box domain-containing protein n=1 Tax=Lophiostoma macrostomum CBS 122681 TaxID=1314788 RepID=A0A6A6TJ75_9PLEO|nr:hypothetical protein K491DRAFT_675112 [Lophiostoma macrostomum CBS 122681]